MVAQRVKRLPAMQETRVPYPGSGRSPGKGNSNPLQFLAWKIPWMEEPGRLQSKGSQRVGHDWTAFFFLSSGTKVKASARNMGDLGSIPGSRRSPGEWNGNPLQYSYLENPMDGRAWWATVHGLQTVRYDWETSLSLSLWWGLPGLYVCVLTLCSVLWFLMAILLCLATMWFRPAAILLELDFLSLCLETRALRNTYLDHL